MGAGQGQRISKLGPTREAPAHPLGSPETYSVHLTALLPIEVPRPPGSLPRAAGGARHLPWAPTASWGPDRSVSHCVLLGGQWTVRPPAGMGLGRPGPLGNCFQVNDSGRGEPHAAFLGHSQPCVGPGGHRRSVTGLPPVPSSVWTPHSSGGSGPALPPAGETRCQFVTIVKCSDVGNYFLSR